MEPVRSSTCQNLSNPKSESLLRIQWHGGRFKSETKLEAIDRVKRGESISSIARELGAQVETVRNWLSQRHKYVKIYKKYSYEAERLKKRESRDSSTDKSDGQAMLTARERPDKETILKACNRLRDGASYKIVAKEFGVCLLTVKTWKRKYMPKGEILPKLISSKLSNKEVLEACNLLRQGETQTSVAKKFGVNFCTVKKWQRKIIPETMDPRKKSYQRAKNHSKEEILAACERFKE